MLDSLADERSFLQVVQAGSLSAAAIALGADVSTVSRRVSALEKRLGVVLLERGVRRSQPTSAGLRYFERLRRLIDELDAVEADIRGDVDVPRGVLRVAAPTNLGEMHVVDWALQFQKAHPEVVIDLMLSDRYVDLRGSGIDVAIRIGALSDSELRARRLGAMQLGLFAASAYLEANGRPDGPHELERHSFVLFSLLQSGDSLRLVAADETPVVIRMATRFSVDNVGAIARAVCDGAGIHAGPLWLFQPLVDAGSLERVLPTWAPPLYPVHMLHSYARRPPAKVSKFVKHIKEQLVRLPGIEA